MKKNEIDRIFKKSDLPIRSTGNNYGWLIVDDKKILRVHYSHGKGDIPEIIVNKIRGQLKLSLDDFTELAKCTLNYNDYISILEEKGYI